MSRLLDRLYAKHCSIVAGLTNEELEERGFEPAVTNYRGERERNAARLHKEAMLRAEEEYDRLFEAMSPLERIAESIENGSASLENGLGAISEAMRKANELEENSPERQRHREWMDIRYQRKAALKRDRELAEIAPMLCMMPAGTGNLNWS